MTSRRLLLFSLLAFIVVAACKSGSAGAPGRLVFGTLPPTVKAGQNFGPLTVAISDSAGHPSTSATNPVTLYLEHNPPGATLGGTLTVNAVAGVATFDNLTIDAASDQYQLAAFAAGLTPGVSPTFVIAPPTGALIPVPGSPFATGDTLPVAMTVDHAGKFLYVGNETGASVAGFAIDSSGALSPVPGSPFSNAYSSGLPGGLAVDSSGQYVISPDPGAQNIMSYAFAGSGTLSPISSIPSQYSTSIVADPIAPILFAANQFNSTVSTFSIAANGTLTQLGSAISTAGQQPMALGIDPAGKFLFVLTQVNLQVFTITGGVLAPTATAWPAGTGGGAVAIDRTGNFVYIASVAEKDVYGYRINADGSLTDVAGSPFLAGAFARLGLAANPNVNVLYMVSNNLRVSQLVLTSSGVISGALANFVPTSGPNSAVAIDRQGKHLFVTTPGSSGGKVFAYTIAQ